MNWNDKSQPADFALADLAAGSSMRTLAVPLAALFVAHAAAAADKVDYTRDIRPILSNNCFKCHGPDGKERKAELRLDVRADAIKPAESGRPAISPGNAGSNLLGRVNSKRENRLMPPPESGKKLSDKEKELLKRWIEEGAEYQIHWAFVPPKTPNTPAIKDSSGCLNNIDYHIRARLEKEGIKPSPEADRYTLIRRLYFDLLGLPPTPAEVDAFVNDQVPGAYERLVDRLLKSQHYGERWGRHWLDLARYADSNGFTIDAARTIWPYRDWVINALNNDLPFDQFITEQLAGDLLPKPTREQLVATGFHRNTLFNQEGGIDQEQFRCEYVVDRVNTTGSVFFGLTVGCCQCHDHKFDPLSQREYYQLFAFFNSCDEPTLDLPTPEQEQKRKDIQAKIAGLEKMRKIVDTTSTEGLARWEMQLSIQAHDLLPPEIQRILDLAVNSRDRKQMEMVREVYRKCDITRHVMGAFDASSPFLRAAHLEIYRFRETVDQQIAGLKKTIPDIPTTLILRERKSPREAYIHLAGDFTRKGATVKPAVPSIMHPMAGVANPNRLDLARWIVDPKNPLTARVTVNRIWQAYFGLGLVETENDFGTQGTLPSHPELLDWLAKEFIARKWSLKSLHKLIVMSATYRQSSNHRPELANIDPRNRLLARQNRLRLDAEVVRDNALAVSGLLNPKIGGPSVFPPQPSGVYAFTQLDKVWKSDAGADRYRRGMYTYFWRSAPHPGLIAFDAPEGNTTCTRRNRSNTPLQALTLLNDEAYLEFAQGLAMRGLNECKGDDRARLEFLFRLCLARKPSAREIERLEKFLTRQTEAMKKATVAEVAKIAPAKVPQGHDSRVVAAWALTARALMNLDEFITRE